MVAAFAIVKAPRKIEQQLPAGSRALANGVILENDYHSRLVPKPWLRKLNFSFETGKNVINRLSNTLAWFPYIWVTIICFFDGLRWILWEIAGIPLNYLISEETLFHLLRLGISGIRANTASEFVPYIVAVWTTLMVLNYVLVGFPRFFPWRH